MKAKDITPESARCGVGPFSQAFELEDGRRVVRAKFLNVPEERENGMEATECGELYFVLPDFLEVKSMNSTEQHLREQISCTERANQQMLEEIKRLNEDNAFMRKIVRDRYFEIQVTMHTNYAGCRDLLLRELSGILGQFEKPVSEEQRHEVVD